MIYLKQHGKQTNKLKNRTPKLVSPTDFCIIQHQQNHILKFWHDKTSADLIHAQNDRVPLKVNMKGSSHVKETGISPVWASTSVLA